MRDTKEFERDLLLIGGGHAHALVIRMNAMKPIPGLRLTLVSPLSITPYSGMLPGHLAGVYSHDEIHIDLRKLCAWAGARYILDEVEHLDLAAKQVRLKETGSLGFDVASINTGSTPWMPAEASPKVCGVKPVAPFLLKFHECLQLPGNPRIAVVGGGASGVEVALNLAMRLPAAHIALIHRGEDILGTYPKYVRKTLRKELKRLKVELHFHRLVEKEEDGMLISEGWRQQFDRIFWTTQASPAPWLKHSGAAVDPHGFLAVNSKLQSLSHPFLFGAGDVISIRDTPVAKSGVYAVRAGKPLFQNLRNFVAGQALEDWRPQKAYLSLIGIGAKTAVASRGVWGFKASWLWRLKDHIDRKFMNQLDPAKTPRVAPNEPMFCRGCAAKSSPTVLAEVLGRDLSTGVSREDAAQVGLGAQHVLLSIDRISAIVDDPFVFGQIAVNHALSDIYAARGIPKYVLVGAELPRLAPPLQARDLRRMMDGIRHQCAELGVTTAGGHTSLASELAITLAAIGSPGQQLSSKVTGEIGDLLVLTKPLGIGVAFAGLMRWQTPASTIDTAIQQMLHANRLSGDVFRKLSIDSVTDVTGFGLAGHLLELLGTQVGATISLRKIPVISGIQALLDQGVLSTAYGQNAAFLEHVDFQTHNVDPRILCDPQTSGGLLAAVPAPKMDELNLLFADQGLGPVAVIGKITARPAKPVLLEP